MPRIDNDIKLDFKDVLFRPKRSTIRSRADVSRRLIFIIILVLVGIAIKNIHLFMFVKVTISGLFIGQ